MTSIKFSLWQVVKQNYFFFIFSLIKGKKQTTNAQIFVIYLSIILIPTILCAVNWNTTFFPYILYHNQDFYICVFCLNLNIQEFCLGFFSHRWESRDFWYCVKGTMEELFSVQYHCITAAFDPPFALIYVCLSYRLVHTATESLCAFSGIVKRCTKERMRS